MLEETKWLQTLDFLLGDTGESPLDSSEAGLANKYDAVSAKLLIGGKEYHVERRWREPGNKTKVFIDEQGMPIAKFQQWLLEQLGIPFLHFPKGNPFSGQTWPELSFRMLLRHIYRQQRFWVGIADKQPDAEQHACILQFLGLAERIYTKEYECVVQLKRESEKLRTRQENYTDTLEQLAEDILSKPGMRVAVSSTTIKDAQHRLTDEVASLRHRRNDLLIDACGRKIPIEKRARDLSLLESVPRRWSSLNNTLGS